MGCDFVVAVACAVVTEWATIVVAAAVGSESGAAAAAGDEAAADAAGLTLFVDIDEAAVLKRPLIVGIAAYCYVRLVWLVRPDRIAGHCYAVAAAAAGIEAEAFFSAAALVGWQPQWLDVVADAQMPAKKRNAINH